MQPRLEDVVVKDAQFTETVIYDLYNILCYTIPQDVPYCTVFCPVHSQMSWGTPCLQSAPRLPHNLLKTLCRYQHGEPDDGHITPGCCRRLNQDRTQELLPRPRDQECSAQPLKRLLHSGSRVLKDAEEAELHHIRPKALAGAELKQSREGAARIQSFAGGLKGDATAS